MPTAVSALVAELIEQGSIDASPTTVLAWLDRRHVEMVAHARAYRDQVTIDTTDAGVGEYVVPDGIVELLEVTVGGVRHVNGLHSDLSSIDQSWLWLSGPGGLAIRSANASSQTTLQIRPAPSESGLPIVAYAAVAPPALLLNDTVPILVEDDLLEALKAGVYATALGGPSQGQKAEADSYLADFQAGKAELRQREKRRLRGPGPAVMRIRGVNA